MTFAEFFTSDFARSLGIWTGVLLIVAWWVRGIAPRRLAKDAGDATIRGEEKGLREYFKAELAECKRESDAIAEKLKAVEQSLSTTENKRFQLTVVVSALLNEHLATDPDSILVRRAKALIELNIGFPVNSSAIEMALERLSEDARDPDKSSALDCAERAVTAAEKTVDRAEKTVTEVKADEKDKGK